MENVTSNQGNPSIRELGGRVRDDIHELRDAAQQRREEIVRAASDFVQENPVTAVAAAFGVGFVLAGGLMSRTTLRLASIGARFYARRFLGEFLGNAAGEMLRGTGIDLKSFLGGGSDGATGDGGTRGGY